MRLGLFLVFAFLGVFVAACATLDAKECQTANWQTLGLQDGENGRLQSRIEKHEKACAKHKLGVNKSAYAAGWQQGIARFCTPQNGFTLGRQRGLYRESCPASLAGPFVAAYVPALRLSRAESEVRGLEHDLDRLSDVIAFHSKSSHPKDVAIVAEARSDFIDTRRKLSWARDNLRTAEADVAAYLRAHPEIRAF